MLPVAIVNNPIPVPIMGTALPGTVSMHVPYDNVAPSISSAQVNNNASPNNGAAAAEDQAEAADSGQGDGADAIVAAANNAVQIQNPGAQTAFLAQLLSQDASPPVQTILVQYEKLVALSNVKYKPSGALKTVPEPANTFGKLLQENRPVQSAAPPEPMPEQPSPAVTAAAADEAVYAGPAPEIAPPRQPTAARTATVPANTDQPVADQTQHIISAYTATATRVDTENAQLTTAVA